MRPTGPEMEVEVGVSVVGDKERGTSAVRPERGQRTHPVRDRVECRRRGRQKRRILQERRQEVFRTQR